MNRTGVEKFGTWGAVVAVAACPACFPKLALIGAILGLGVLAPYERYIALVVQVLCVIALIGQVLAFRMHRNVWVLALAAASTALMFAAYYVVGSTLLLELALFGLAAASVWQVVEMRRCVRCAAVQTQ